MGDDYIDYNLVLAQETGRPCEDRIIGNQFERLKNPLVFQMLFFILSVTPAQLIS